MRLNFDCVRDILLCVEENTDLRHLCAFVDIETYQQSNFSDEQPEIQPYQKALMQKYDNDTIIYHIYYCNAAGLLLFPEVSEPDRIDIEDLTPDGHSFLANIREPSNWEKIKTVGHKLGCTSLPTLSNIASQVVAALIKQYLKLS